MNHRIIFCGLCAPISVKQNIVKDSRIIPNLDKIRAEKMSTLQVKEQNELARKIEKGEPVSKDWKMYLGEKMHFGDFIYLPSTAEDSSEKNESFQSLKNCCFVINGPLDSVYEVILKYNRHYQ